MACLLPCTPPSTSTSHTLCPYHSPFPKYRHIPLPPMSPLAFTPVCQYSCPFVSCLLTLPMGLVTAPKRQYREACIRSLSPVPASLMDGPAVGPGGGIVRFFQNRPDWALAKHIFAWLYYPLFDIIFGAVLGARVIPS